MADYTQNYNLKKPIQTDFYNIDDFNDNADIIDEALSNKLNSDFSNVSGGAVPIENGGTGATTASSARTNLGLGISNIPTFNALNLTNATVNGKSILSPDSTEYNVYILPLNSTNIDSDTERNYTTGISDTGHGTRPCDRWQNIFNIVGGHFRAQIAIEAHAGSNADVNMWIRSKYLDSGWSNWICATKIFVQETQPSYAVNGSLWAW